jgi:NTE family protein
MKAELLGQPPATPYGVAIALGGGGARGLAHIVVLEALDELGVRPLALAGASMGAIIAAAYAAGMRARDIRAYALRVLRNRRLLLGRMLEARVGRFTDLLVRGLVNPVLIDAELILPSFWPEEIPARFEELAIPLAVVATDFNARDQIVLRTGLLRNAVAGSMAIPGLLKPVLRDGYVLVDGGVVNPLPYELLFDHASIVLACDVSPGRADGQKLEPKPFEAMLGTAQIMQAALTARMLRARPPHLLVRPPVERFRLLDFFYAARILEAAEACKENLKRDLEPLLEAAL